MAIGNFGLKFKRPEEEKHKTIETPDESTQEEVETKTDQDSEGTNTD